ncbi:ABC transporter substrate-binding protein [Shewanella sp. NIFS-20-20]|uniref:ABC transporter substrate-binding protein n=1 Tax=Shewanella sp. NIFS-20-20 TaxID=2853806 RepID=UPI001C455B2F|nr:ABC transporter substrate-binding protein [Shewanella sp. NIFS-20-20]MBV7315034.1 ABC transporter substrate-binding protein [Shewanella sp. NIFS-20-20]
MQTVRCKWIWLGIAIVSLFPAIALSHPIKIAVSKTPLSAPIIVAKQQGFFEKFGLDIQLIPTAGGDLCLQKLLNNEVDLATTSDSVIMFEMFNRQDFSVLANFATSDNDIKIFSTRGHNIHSIGDIENKRVGLIQSSASEYLFDQLLILHDLRHIQHSRHYYHANELAMALLTGEVDIISIWEPYGYRLKTNNDHIVQAFDTRGLTTRTFNLVSQIGGKNNDDWVAILTAIEAANAHILKNEAQSKEVVQQFLKIELSELTSLWPDYHFRLSSSLSLIPHLRNSAHWAISSGNTRHDRIPDFTAIMNSQALQIMRTSQGKLQ